MTLQAEQLNSLALAYMGDAVFELHVRTHLLKTGFVRPNALHQAAVHYVSASAQAPVIHAWLEKNVLTDVEKAIVRRGRNAKSGSTPRNMSIQAYRYATAFEALLGYHYLNDNKQR